MNTIDCQQISPNATIRKDALIFVLTLPERQTKNVTKTTIMLATSNNKNPLNILTLIVAGMVAQKIILSSGSVVQPSIASRA